MDSILEFDTWLFLAVNGFNSEFVDPFMRAFSGKNVWIVMYVSIAAVIWWRFGWRKALLLVAATGIAVGLSDFICASVIRPFFQRMRPSNLDNELNACALVHIVDGYRSGKYGFPSCHAANSFALATITSFILRDRKYIVFILLWAFMQCYSRVYLGVHYPGDLAVGALIGSAIAYGMYALCSKFVIEREYVNLKSSTWPAIAVGLGTCLYIFIVKCLIV